MHIRFFATNIPHCTVPLPKPTGEPARLAQLELEKQIAEARYEVYKENTS